MDDVGRIERLWVKRAHRGPMDGVPQATLVADQGMEGSVGRSRRRQVSILAQEDWNAALGDIGATANPARRRANIMLSGIALANTRGRVLSVGDVRIAVGGELTPCERMEEIAPGLQNAMRANWRGGVFGQVLVGGIVRVGDAVRWESAGTAAAESVARRVI